MSTTLPAFVPAQSTVNSCMLPYAFTVVFSFSIAIAVAIGLIRIGKILPSYRPFVYILVLSLLVEIVNLLLSHYVGTNAVSVNVYILVDCYLWLWQFSCWGSFKNNRSTLWLLVGCLSAIWMVEHVWIQKIWTFSSIFRISYSFVLVFLCIDQLNHMIANERKSLLRSARFLICLGIVFFYSYKILVETFYLFHLTLSDTFYSYLYYILVWMNLFVNLLFALAALWIPTRQRFTLPS